MIRRQNWYDDAMLRSILTTKLHIPAHRQQIVPRPRLIKQLNRGLRRKLTLISAPAGSGKTTLVIDWLSDTGHPVTWISLDESDNDPGQFLLYLISALQNIEPALGEHLFQALQSAQVPAIEPILRDLLNEIAMIEQDFILVLDDYHVVDSEQVDNAIVFLIEYMPPQMQLVITTREDPQFPVSRLRVRQQITELRASDLRFTHDEIAKFLNQIMGLKLSVDNIIALEARTEGWIAGLQLAAISMQDHDDVDSFIESFTGSHHFVLDYLVEEVLYRQSEQIQDFLLITSILERMNGALCDAILPGSSGQEILEYLERSNLFVIALDNDRYWYRYHHLFAQLLRQKLLQQTTSDKLSEIHLRASQWFESNGLEMEAFQHAIANDDIDRAEYLIEGQGMPLVFRGMVRPILSWLNTLPPDELETRPVLTIWSAFASTVVGETVDVEAKLQSAEKILQNEVEDARIRDLLGHIAAMRAMLAFAIKDAGAIMEQSQQALDLLKPDNLALRTSALWTLGCAYHLQGNRTEASKAYKKALSASTKTNNTMLKIASGTSLAQIQEGDNQLHQAAETYQTVLDIIGNPPLPFACESYLGLARIHYQWNQLETTENYIGIAKDLAGQLDNVDTPVSCDVALARLKLAQKDSPGAIIALNTAEQVAISKNFIHRLPQIIETRIHVLLQSGSIDKAINLLEEHDLPPGEARVLIARAKPSAALDILENIADEQANRILEVKLLQAIAYHKLNRIDEALQALSDAMMIAQPAGFIRIFVDEGEPMLHLLTTAADHAPIAAYARELLSAFEVKDPNKSLIEPLSDRELEVLDLIAQGLSNKQIGEKLFLALNTVKGHNRRIFAKLDVQRRTEAILRARELGLI